MKARSNALIAAALTASLALSPLTMLRAADPAAPVAAPAHDPAALVQSEIDKGLEYLKSQQRPDGSWGVKEEDPPALTAIALRAFVGDPKYANEPFVKKGFDKLLTYQEADGSISSHVLATYNTAIACSTLALSGDPKYKAAADKAVAYLRTLQWTDKIEGVEKQSKKVDPSDPSYGGWGYSGKGRADMSNAQFALEALHDAGLKPGDPAYDAALKFITRDQNNSETNKDQPWAGDDGGFVYTPAEGGVSEVRGKAVGPNGQRIVRSYGSMTYAGLKSMIYAGLTKDDPRVKAAWKWISNNWNLEINPGMQFGDLNDPKVAEQGLFYYYHTLARALRAYGEPTITDSKGVKHDWRIELIDVLAKQQSADGHWTGVQRFMEDRPGLSTSYAILAAEEARNDLKEHPGK